MKIYIGADHRGFKLKEEIKKYFYEKGIEYEDLGAQTFDPNDDYPMYAGKVAEKVTQSRNSVEDARGVVICGSGVGVDIVANKFEGIRCGLAVTPGQVKAARADDNINVLALAADTTESGQAIELLKTFVETGFDPSQKHTRRLNEIQEIEKDRNE